MSFFDEIMKEIAGVIMDMIFPPRCMLCDRILTEGRQTVCSSCDGLIEPIRDGCGFCGAPMGGLSECLSCKNESFRFAGNMSYTRYDEAVKQLVYGLKYHNRPELAAKIAKHMLSSMGRNFFAGFDAMIPVPLFRAKERERGYNQSELLSAELCRLCRVRHLPQCLVRVRSTAAQSKISVTERRKNVAGAFAVKNPELLIGKKILLVDDICTTGSTLDECAAVLLGSGAAEVRCLSFARAGKNSPQNIF